MAAAEEPESAGLGGAVNGGAANGSGWDSDAGGRASKRPRSADSPGPESSPATATAGADEREEREEEEEEVYVSRGPVDERALFREALPPEGVAAAVAEVRGMWEAAAVLDFLHLFRPQLKLMRAFTAEELERVLVTSPGDSGLLADIHLDLMRGISPKSGITLKDWQTHLANKIRFHWRNLADGTPCPFKPEKYLEAATYAGLAAPARVRALHFLCCIRADREDIQARIAEAEREKSEEERAAAAEAAEAAAARAARGTRGAAAEEDDGPEGAPFETLDTFRRGPTGVGAGGAAFYYFDHADTTGARIYREGPPPADPEEAEAVRDREEELEEEAEARAAAADAKAGRRRRERALRKMPLPKPVFRLRDPPRPGSWELAAASLGQVEELGQALAGSRPAADRALGRLVLEEIVPALREKEEEEERRRRAAERVRSRLGVGEGGGGSGDEGGLGVGGRSRRARAQVNYAFTDYDNQLRSAIRYSQRRGDSPGFDSDGWGEGRRRRRALSPLNLTGEEAAAMGLRRGRSSAALRGADSMPDLDERAIRLAAARARSDGSEGPGGGPRGGTTASGRRSRLAPKYARDYVEDFDDADMLVESGEEGDGSSDGDGDGGGRGARRGPGRGAGEGSGRGAASERFLAAQAQQDAEAVAAVAAQRARQAQAAQAAQAQVHSAQAAQMALLQQLILQQQHATAGGGAAPGGAPGGVAPADLVRLLAERQAQLQAAQQAQLAAAAPPPQPRSTFAAGPAPGAVPMPQPGQGVPPPGTAPAQAQRGPVPQGFISQNAPETAARTAAAPGAPGPWLVNWGGHGPRHHNPTPRVPPPP